MENIDGDPTDFIAMKSTKFIELTDKYNHIKQSVINLHAFVLE